MPTPEIRLGGVKVVFIDGRHFLIEDCHDPSKQVMVDDKDVVDLIGFLHQHSPALTKLKPPAAKPATPHSRS